MAIDRARLLKIPPVLREATDRHPGIVVPSIRPVVAALQYLGPWHRVDLAAGLTDDALRFSGTTNGAARWPMLFPGEIRGLGVTSTAAVSAGSATFEIFVDGADAGATDAVLDTTNTIEHLVYYNAGDIRYKAGETIDVRVTTSGGFAPTTADVGAVVLVSIDDTVRQV